MPATTLTTPDLRSSTIVPCSGPHTDEVTLVRDLTGSFPTMPTNDQIQTLNNQLCPAAAQAWTGGTEQRYTPDISGSSRTASPAKPSAPSPAR